MGKRLISNRSCQFILFAHRIANRVCQSGLPIGFANRVCQSGLPIGFANRVCQSGLPIIRVCVSQGKDRPKRST